MVEFILSGFLWIGLLTTLMGIHRYSWLRLKALHVAEMGAELRGSGLIEDGVIYRVLDDYVNVSHLKKYGDWNISLSRFTNIPSSGFYQLNECQVRGEITGSAMIRYWSGLTSISENVVVQKASLE